MGDRDDVRRTSPVASVAARADRAERVGASERYFTGWSALPFVRKGDINSSGFAAIGDLEDVKKLNKLLRHLAAKSQLSQLNRQVFSVDL